MNRRQFLVGSAGLAALLPALGLAETDSEIEQASIMRMFRILPDRPGAAGLDFPVTSAIDHAIHREARPENPDTHLEQMTQDMNALFGIPATAISLSVQQDAVEAWIVDQNHYSREDALELMRENGWEITNRELSIFRYTGTSDERSALAESLNLLGNQIAGGRWDWIAAPTDRLLVLGSDPELIRSVAELQIQFGFTPMTESSFPGLVEVVRHDTYVVQLLPIQALPMENTDAVLLSKSWAGSDPIINSVGMSIGSADDVGAIAAKIEERFHNRKSSITNQPYAEFLILSEPVKNDDSLRIDIVDTSGKWDVYRALKMDDLGMLPLL